MLEASSQVMHLIRLGSIIGKMGEHKVGQKEASGVFTKGL
jgi:hypothetical protein